MSARILVAGIGNELFGDDGFGVAVVRALGRRPLPPDVRAVEFGIRGFDLAAAFLDGGYEAIVLVDAAPRGGAPGTLRVIEPDEGPTAAAGGRPDPHGLTPEAILSWVHALAGPRPAVFLVGCEPGHPVGDEPVLGLSAPVEAAVPPAVELVESLLARLGAASAPAG